MFDLTQIYGSNNAPYRAWLEAATQNRDIEHWLARYLIRPLREHIEHDTPLSVLDAGSGWGDMGFRLHRRLRHLGLTNVRYHAADPVGEHVVTFARLAEEQQLTGITTQEGGIMQLELPREGRYDLVFSSHTLYYVENMELALRRLLDLGERMIIVHRGQRGIQTIQEAFAEHVGMGPHIISTANDVYTHLQRCMLDDSRDVQTYGFSSSVDVTTCDDPTSEHGNSLLAFFLHQRFEDIPPVIVERVRTFIRNAYGPSNYKMSHDVSVFVVS